MIPILFEYNATDFTTHGLGDLIDCVACESQMTDEGEWELSFKYPVSSELFNELTIGRIVYAKANSWQGNQQFRIYGYEKEIGGMMTINCEHISYDLRRIPVRAFKSAKNGTQSQALNDLRSNAIAISDLSIGKFSLSSNVSGGPQNQDRQYKLESPSSARAALLDGDDSIKGTFGGDIVFDNYSVQLLTTGGADRGVVIEYGVDLMDLKQEENISEMYTGVLPYYRWTAENTDDEQYTYGDIQYKSGSFRNQNIRMLDLTDYYPNQAEHTSPSASELNSKAREWMAAEDNFGEPEVNLTLSYAKINQDVRLHDAITVRFVKLGVNKTSKVTSYKYDVLRERVIEVEVGKTKSSAAFSLEDASRLRRGLLPPERIKNKSLTSDKYADSSIGSAALGTGSVGTPKLADAAVKEGKIDNGAVTEGKINDNAVTVNKIRDGAVITSKIEDGAVIENKILNQAVSYAKLSEDLQVFYTDILAANAIYSGFLHADGSVTATWVNTKHLGINGEEFGPTNVSLVYGINGSIGVDWSWDTAWTSRQEEHRHQYSYPTSVWTTGSVNAQKGSYRMLLKVSGSDSN